MKKLTAWIIFLALAVTLLAAVPASADEYMKYVNRDTLEAYKEPDADSKVLKRLKGGDQVMLSGNILLGSKFTSILLADTKHGGQMEAWVLTKYLVDDMPQKYCKHQWGKWVVTDEPTCTHSGERERICKICDKVQTETLKRLEHEFGKWRVIKEATCVKEGQRERTCRLCGYKQKETYLEDHTFGKWTVTEEPTCTETGERVRRCKVCGYEEAQTLEKLPHEYEWKVTKQPTDHTQGVREKICKVCGHKGGKEDFDPDGTMRRNDRGDDVRALQQLLVDQGYLNAGGADGIFGGGTEKALIQFQKDQGLEPDGVAWPQTVKRLQHDFGPWQTLREMTRTEAGERVRTCRDCGYEQHETVEPSPRFVRGNRGEAIRALQQIMSQLGYNAGGFDGIYGRKLDTAYEAFADDHGLVAENGVIRPADVDAAINAWLDEVPDNEWKGEAQDDGPVNLALTVTPTDRIDDSGMVTYNWSLTNLGSGRCTFSALLLTFGRKADFRSEDLVMVLDGLELKPNAANNASGSFTADMEWGEGNLNFAALAVYERTGGKYLSNVVTYENESDAASKTVAPIPVETDVNRLPDGVWPVAFDRGDILSGKSGIYMNAVHIFSEDRYAAEDIDALAEGDSIIVDGETIVVRTLDRDGGVTINGGLGEDDGVDLREDEETGAWRVVGYDDLATYTEHGVTTLIIESDTTYTDVSDPQQIPTVVRGADIVDAMMKADEYATFDQYNTRVTIEGGRLVSISHLYTP